MPTLCLYHLIPGNQTYRDEAWRAGVTPYFRGEVLVARDLLEI